MYHLWDEICITPVVPSEGPGGARWGSACRLHVALTNWDVSTGCVTGPRRERK